MVNALFQRTRITCIHYLLLKDVRVDHPTQPVHAYIHVSAGREVPVGVGRVESAPVGDTHKHTRPSIYLSTHTYIHPSRVAPERISACCAEKGEWRRLSKKLEQRLSAINPGHQVQRPDVFFFLILKPNIWVCFSTQAHIFAWGGSVLKNKETQHHINQRSGEQLWRVCVRK